jgi:hypothetical protein
VVLTGRRAEKKRLSSNRIHHVKIAFSWHPPPSTSTSTRPSSTFSLTTLLLPHLSPSRLLLLPLNRTRLARLAVHRRLASNPSPFCKASPSRCQFADPCFWTGPAVRDTSITSQNSLSTRLATLLHCFQYVRSAGLRHRTKRLNLPCLRRTLHSQLGATTTTTILATVPLPLNTLLGRNCLLLSLS